MYECDAHGLRPLCPFKLLSAYEFLRHWQTIPLLVPTYRSDTRIERLALKELIAYLKPTGFTLLTANPSFPTLSATLEYRCVFGLALSANVRNRNLIETEPTLWTA